jgi:hypothetical protein
MPVYHSAGWKQYLVYIIIVQSSWSTQSRGKVGIEIIDAPKSSSLGLLFDEIDMTTGF